LTVVGVFGVVNHGTVRRTREMGIRVSLGAAAHTIRRIVIRRAMVPALLGMTAGAVISFWWSPALESLLFDMRPHDISTFLIAGGIVLGTVLLASAVPAWRASRVDPAIVLRCE
jgi:putative ABC transport system permease protein